MDELQKQGVALKADPSKPKKAKKKSSKDKPKGEKVVIPVNNILE